MNMLSVKKVLYVAVGCLLIGWQLMQSAPKTAGRFGALLFALGFVVFIVGVFMDLTVSLKEWKAKKEGGKSA